MTAEQNVEVVRRAYEAVARGDLEAALDAFDAAVAVEDHDRSLESATMPATGCSSPSAGLNAAGATDRGR